MKILVFAHTPPPDHGQSRMVAVMLQGLRALNAASMPHGEAIECHHVNCRLSADEQEVGRIRLGKLPLLLKYCAQAIRLRYKHRISCFYYIPGPPKPSAIFRDWAVMALCRPFFSKLVLHWHAAGLPEWLDKGPRLPARITERLLKRADLAIVLSEYGRLSMKRLDPRRVAVIPNGIEDPCPDFLENVLPERNRRLAARRLALSQGAWTPAENPACAEFVALFLSACTREKGLFDALDAILLLNRNLSRQRRSIFARLMIAGHFLSAEEEREFTQKAEAINNECLALSNNPSKTPTIERIGFVDGPKKADLFRQADALCFPTYYKGETQGLVVIEALAHGLPVVATKWHGVEESLPSGYPWIVSPKRPEETARALEGVMAEANFVKLRNRFEERYTLRKYLENLAHALLSVEKEPKRRTI
ncbi:MAG: glycosyltransferase family 4 protein [Verrucomicrobia bacterium]|nr:glycosyltransferase family 4 protein [Verrucomicrobiota bacterium]